MSDTPDTTNEDTQPHDIVDDAPPALPDVDEMQHDAIGSTPADAAPPAMSPEDFAPADPPHPPWDADDTETDAT